jgi:hypothetical protein
MKLEEMDIIAGFVRCLRWLQFDVIDLSPAFIAKLGELSSLTSKTLKKMTKTAVRDTKNNKRKKEEDSREVETAAGTGEEAAEGVFDNPLTNVVVQTAEAEADGDNAATTNDQDDQEEEAEDDDGQEEEAEEVTMGAEEEKVNPDTLNWDYLDAVVACKEEGNLSSLSSSSSTTFSSSAVNEVLTLAIIWLMDFEYHCGKSGGKWLKARKSSSKQTNATKQAGKQASVTVASTPPPKETTSSLSTIKSKYELTFVGSISMLSPWFKRGLLTKAEEEAEEAHIPFRMLQLDKCVDLSNLVRPS